MFENYRKYAKGILCPICKKPMEIDDIDYNFDGCQDEYWGCSECSTSAFVKVRYSRIVSSKIVDTNGLDITPR